MVSLQGALVGWLFAASLADEMLEMSRCLLKVALKGLVQSTFVSARIALLSAHHGRNAIEQICCIISSSLAALVEVCSSPALASLVNYSFQGAWLTVFPGQRGAPLSAYFKVNCMMENNVDNAKSFDGAWPSITSTQPASSCWMRVEDSGFSVPGRGPLDAFTDGNRRMDFTYMRSSYISLKPLWLRTAAIASEQPS
ncbi:hypothetical protein GE09DRAFT_564167 [Coniochaeta sp. 2T2.1]|nr:hypothetical protein GE09DRAFT_564167 [Coniochaeta sp. 2T2.1]